MLATKMNRVECVRALLEHGAVVAEKTPDGWSVFKEAVATGNSELIRLVYKHKERQAVARMRERIPQILRALSLVLILA